MKARVTFILDGEREFEPAQLKIAKDSLNVAEVPVDIREDRITLGLDELQDGIRVALEQTHELHLRWQSPRFTDAPEPYSSRVAPGLHVYYTPSKRPDA